jgi:hypothetical protein
MATLSATLRRGRTFRFWNVRMSPSRQARAGVSSPTSVPKTEMLPEVGRSPPVRTLKNVVLPAPLGPIRAVTIPSATSRVTSRLAVRSPNCTVIPVAARAAP